MKTYSELIKLPTFEERFEYLKLNSNVGVSTFGFDRYLNQKFYHSEEWKRFRRGIILRDEGCDLGITERDIFGPIVIHHINPIEVKDISNYDLIMNPEFVICTSHKTHNAIHFGDSKQIEPLFSERKPGDTRLW